MFVHTKIPSQAFACHGRRISAANENWPVGDEHIEQWHSIAPFSRQGVLCASRSYLSCTYRTLLTDAPCLGAPETSKTKEVKEWKMKMKQKKNAQIGAIAMDEHKMHIYLSHPNANAYLMYIVVVQMHTCTLASVWCDERPSRIEITNT